jgi:hypothetical protein
MDNTFELVDLRGRHNVLKERQRLINHALDAYHGRLIPPLRVRPGAPDDNVLVNTSGVIVDKGVSFLFGKGVKWALDDNTETRSEDEKLLDATWDANGGEVILHNIATNAGITGHGFIKLRITEPFVTLSVVDSAKVDVVTSDHDYTQVLAYTLSWDGRKDPQTGKQRRYRQIIQRVERGFDIDPETLLITEIPQHWKIIDQQTDSQDIDNEKVWVTVMIEDWPFDFAPIVGFQNLPNPNEYWGKPDLSEDIIKLNQAINRSLSNINRIIRIHAHPKTWSKGLTEQQIHQIVIDPEGMIHLPGELGSIQNLEMASDLSSSINYYKELKNALFEISRVPKIAYGNEENVNYLAAVAMQVLYGPLIEKTEIKRKLTGAFIREVNRRILAIHGRGNDKLCQLIWPNILPRDTLIEAQVALLEMQLGVSRETLINKLGYNAAYEEKRKKVEQADDIMQAGLLAKATAVARPVQNNRPEDRPHRENTD